MSNHDVALGDQIVDVYVMIRKRTTKRRKHPSHTVEAVGIYVVVSAGAFVIVPVRGKELGN